MTAEEHFDIVIVGAGIAGLTACRYLSEKGIRVCLVSGEDRIPYKRTKISKHMASGFLRDQFALLDEPWYRSNNVELIVADPVVGIDTAQKKCTTKNGRVLGYGKLLLATGGRPILLPGHEDVERSYVVHAASDVDRIISDGGAISSVLVVGGGVLGVEVAEQLHTMGKRVTLAVSTRRLMRLELDDYASEQLAGCFGNAGVELLFDSRVEGIEPAAPGVKACFGRGNAVYDAVVSCTGISPETEVARNAGIAVGRGILVNERFETSEAHVYAAGDVAEHSGGIVTKLWHAAEEQGRLAAGFMTGEIRTEGLGRHRLKCEVFGRYFFSLRLPQEHGDEFIDQFGAVYRSLQIRDGRTVGIVMIDDGDRAKIYERAVREGWSPERIGDEIPLPAGTGSEDRSAAQA